MNYTLSKFMQELKGDKMTLHIHVGTGTCMYMYMYTYMYVDMYMSKYNSLSHFQEGLLSAQ